MIPDVLEVVAEGWSDGLRPEPPLLVSEWADRYRVLPQKSSAEPGPWRTARTPYLRAIMDDLSTSSPIDEVIVQAGSQLGKSEGLNNVLGYAIDHAPGPVLLVQPTVDTAKRYSRQRIDPLISATPRLAGKVAAVKSRDRSNTMLAKEFDGGILVITGANSAAGLRSMPVRWLLLDEIDNYPEDVDGEGAPVELAEARTRTFARRKILKVSSPTWQDASPIEASYLATDRRRYFVPCPVCDAMQTLEFDRLKWKELGRPAESVAYECEACGALISEAHKGRMLERGEWRPTAESSRPGLRGYHLSALYSPVGWLSWSDIARQHDRDHRDPAKFQVFQNTVLAKTWRRATVTIGWETLYRRREGYRIGVVPAGAYFLTVGVDVQIDHLVYEVVGWGPGKTSWSVEWGKLLGDTADAGARGPWAQLDGLLARSFPRADGGSPMQVVRLAIDSNYNTSQVHAWARRHPASRVRAVRGYPGTAGMILGPPRSVQVSGRGTVIKHGHRHWPVYGHVVKDELFGFLGLEAPLEGLEYPPGFCHFPEYEDVYFQQLTAEQLVPVKGGRGMVYEQIPNRPNHVLDVRVYARAAAEPWLSQWTEADWLAAAATLGLEGSGEYDDEAPPDGAEIIR